MPTFAYSLLGSICWLVGNNNPIKNIYDEKGYKVWAENMNTLFTKLNEQN